jgi:cell division protein FtsQ
MGVLAIKNPSDLHPRAMRDSASDQGGFTLPWKKIAAVCLGMLIGLCCLGAYKLALGVMEQPISTVSVQGEYRHLDKQDLQAVIEPHLSGGFFAIDLQRIKLELESVPWVYQADVKRVWPAELMVSVVEQVPLVKWKSDGYLNAQGQPFYPTGEVELNRLPVLSAPEGHQQKILAAYQWLVPALSAYGFSIDILDLDAKGAMNLVLSNGLVLKFGFGSYEAKLNRFLLTYESKLKEKLDLISYVDLRYTNGLSVGWTNKK